MTEAVCAIRRKGFAYMHTETLAGATVTERLQCCCYATVREALAAVQSATLTDDAAVVRQALVGLVRAYERVWPVVRAQRAVTLKEPEAA